ncbi:MAG: T9SS type A sorting domain-containing protein, partial [Bacteroidota bacterium]
RNAVRFFRASFEGNADRNLDGMPDGVVNEFGIDTSQIAVGGTGTGGYMSYGATYLKRYEQTLEQKYIDFTDPNNPEPFLDTLIFGDPYGIDSAAINRPNYPSYSSDFKMGFAFGGALGSRQWVEAGDPPFVALHCERDPGAPYNVGDVLAVDPNTNPPSPFAVIPEGAGGFAVISRADSLGNQDIFKNIDWGDTLFTIAAAKSGGLTGLYPFDTPFTPGDAMCEGVGVPGDTLVEWGGPWNYFNEVVGELQWNGFYAAAIMAGLQDSGSVAVCVNKRGNPNDPVIANLYMDTLVNYLTPHLSIALGLGTSVGTTPTIEDENVEVFPNPANNFLTIQYRDGIKNIEAVKLLDLSGRTVRNYTDLKTTEFELQRNDLTPGLYILQVSLPDGVVNKKILFE